jgi:pimeloyl-ACP methyl ester carboxylesterase
VLDVLIRSTGNRGPADYAQRMPKHGESGDSWVSERLRVGGTSVYCRRSTHEDGVPLVHLHGFAISGAYLMPTARALAVRGVNVVPDLPGYGRSERRERVLDIPELAETTLAILDRLDIERAVLVGNSMGCPISLEVAHLAPERIHGLVLVSPAGGVHNQPMIRALGQLAKDVLRERTAMFPVALPDYVKFGPLNGLRLFRQLTRFPSLERLLSTPAPTLAVLGLRDPLMPPPDRIREIARLAPQHLTVALVDEAAHAVNFSHPRELAGVTAAWLDEAIADGTRLPRGVRVVTD